MVTRVYSAPLGAISDAQLEAALARWGLGRLVGAEPVRTGNFGQNLFVTSTEGDWVLRGAPHSPDQFPHERFFARLLAERTDAPAPWPYMYEPDSAVFGWPYVLMPRLRGLEIEHPEVARGLSADDRRGIARALGETLAAMQRLTWERAGEYHAALDGVRPFAEGYAAWVIERVRHPLAASRAHTPGRTTAEDARWVEEVLERGRPALGIPFTPRFVMADYKWQNALVERDGDGWRVSGVFDIAGWFGDGEAALLRQAAMYRETEPALAGEFVERYLERLPPRPGFRERWPAYALLERLPVWEWAQREGLVWWDPGLTLREWAAPFTVPPTPPDPHGGGKGRQGRRATGAAHQVARGVPPVPRPAITLGREMLEPRRSPPASPLPRRGAQGMGYHGPDDTATEKEEATDG